MMSLEENIQNALKTNNPSALKTYLNSIRYAPVRFLTNKAVFEQAFIKAAENGQLECLKLLRHHVEDLNAKSTTKGQKQTALHEAARGGHLECLEYLIAELGAANLTRAPRDNIRLTPMMYAINTAKSGPKFDQCLAPLLALPENNVDTIFPGRNTLLFRAAISPSNACLKLVLEKTKLIDHKDVNGRGVEACARFSGIKETQLATIREFRAKLSGSRDGDLQPPPTTVAAPAREASTQEGGADNSMRQIQNNL